MKKLSMILLVLLFLLTREVPQNTAYAVAPAPTPTITPLPTLKTLPTVKRDYRVEALKNYLQRRGSPLADNAGDFVTYADANNIDWRLVASISGVESGYGFALPAGSYNAWGFGIYGNHVRYFASYKDAIATISQALRINYINKLGSDNVYAIGHMYAASSTWASRVAANIISIDTFAEQYTVDTEAKDLPLTL